MAFISWLDKCYVVCEDPKLLLEYLQLLRKELLKPKPVVLFRAVVSEGCAFRNRDQTQPINVDFTSVAASLEGRLQHLKAVAIAIDSDVRDILIRNKDTETWAISTLFQNIALTGVKSDRLEVFYDVAFGASDIERKSITETFQRLSEAIHRSKKAGRFFIPLLINIGRSIPTTKAGLSILNELVDELVEADNSLLKLKGITNSELVYFLLLDRFYRRVADKLDEDGIKFWEAFETRFVEYFARDSRWLKERLQKDHKDGNVPSCILSAPARGHLTRLFAKEAS